jgi:hypothetical protein
MPPQFSRGGNTKRTQTKKPVKKAKPAPKPLVKRPAPPASTGPIIAPQGELRARAAAKHNFSDEARRDLARTPIDYDTTMGLEGAYDHEDNEGRQGRIFLGGPQRDLTDILAHEYTHKRYFNDWGHGPQTRPPDDQAQQYIADTEALGRAGNPGITRTLEDWNTNTRKPYQDALGEDINADLHTYSPELHASTVEWSRPGELPDWYVNKWYPGQFGPARPVGNQRPRFDNEPIMRWR